MAKNRHPRSNWLDEPLFVLAVMAVGAFLAWLLTR